MKLLSMIALCISVGLYAMEPAVTEPGQHQVTHYVPTLQYLAADAVLSERCINAYKKGKPAYQPQAAIAPEEAYTILRRSPRLWKYLPSNTRAISYTQPQAFSIAWGPDKQLATSCMNSIFILNSDTLEMTKRLDGHIYGITSLTYGPDGQLTSTSYDGTIKRWNTLTGSVVAPLAANDSAVYHAAHGPYNQLASAHYDTTVKIWNLDTGSEVLTCSGHNRIVYTVAYGPDVQLASGACDDTVKIWDVSTGQETQTLQGHQGPVQTIAYGAEGQLVSGSWDKTIKIWDPRVDVAIKTLTGHRDWVNSIAYRSDWQLASCSDDRTIKIWDIARGQEITTLFAHDNRVHDIAYESGTRLASCSSDSTVKIWSQVDTGIGNTLELLDAVANTQEQKNVQKTWKDNITNSTTLFDALTDAQ